MSIARFMRERSFKVKKFKQQSLTIPGLAVTPEQVIELCKTGQAVRVHQSGSYDDDPNLERISPFQRGFEMVDLAPSPREAREELDRLSMQIRKQKNVYASSPEAAQSAEPAGSALGGGATASPQEAGEKKV